MANLTFDDVCRKLKDKDNFSFSRWGDGEWSAVLGYEGRNCDGHSYFADMSLALACVLLQDQRYYMGMQPKALKDIGDEISGWLKENECWIDWCDADILHDASTEGRLAELHAAMKVRKKILVGPAHLKPLAQKMQAYYVFCPNINSWKWWTTMYADASEQFDKDVVVMYCSGMPTEVMIDKAHREYGDTITQIDCGSVFDPYVGKQTRKYHKQIIERLEIGI